MRICAAMLIALACCGAMDTPLPHGGAPRSGYTVGPTTFAVLAAAAAGAGWATSPSHAGPPPAKRARTGAGQSSCLEDMAMGHLMEGDGPDDYAQLRRDLAALVTSPHVGFTRPQPKDRTAGKGKRLVRGADAMVPVPDDKLRHLTDAMHTHALPGKGPAACLQADCAYHLTPAAEQAIKDMLELHHAGALPQWRNERIQTFNAIASRAASLNRRIAAAASPLPEPVVKLGKIRQVNVALLVLLVDVLEWPDKDLPAGFLHGFRAVGVIADTGVHRPLQPPPLGDMSDFRAHHDTVMATNVSWAREAAAKVTANARSAAKDTARPERVEAMRAVWEATVKEADDGWMGSGITLQELLSTYGNVSGKHPQNGPVGTLNARVMMRHGVYQGYKQKKAKGKGKKSKSKPVFDEEGKPIMVRKLRCIDDAKASRSNSCEYTYETIATCSFDYVAHVAEAVAAECAAKALPMPEMVFSTDDMRAAYRQIPCSQPGHTMVCVYKFGKDEGPRFFPVHGFNFGHVSSVVQYNRCPELLTHAARKIFLCVTEHYADDYAVPDVVPPVGAGSHALGHSRAQRALTALHNAVGLLLEPDKSTTPAQTNTFLGVRTHLEGVSGTESPQAVFTPSARRLQGVLDKLQECRDANHLDKHEAEILQGKLQFIRGHSFRGVGRAATQPLLTRSGKAAYTLPGGAAPPPRTDEFDAAMRVMHDFLTVLFAHLPPLVRRLGLSRARKPVLVYSDAQYNERTGSAGLGVVIVDLEKPDDARFMAGAQSSPELLQWMPERKQQVNQLELLAALCACMTFADMLREREVVLYIDNTTALSSCIHGYSHAPDMGKMANALTLLLAQLQCLPQFLHVPGKSNPSDLPSRAPWTPGPDGRPQLDLALVRDKDAAQQLRDRACAEALNKSFNHRQLLMPTPSELEDTPYFLTGVRSSPT